MVLSGAACPSGPQSLDGAGPQGAPPPGRLPQGRVPWADAEALLGGGVRRGAALGPLLTSLPLIGARHAASASEGEQRGRWKAGFRSF